MHGRVDFSMISLSHVHIVIVIYDVIDTYMSTLYDQAEDSPCPTQVAARPPPCTTGPLLTLLAPRTRNFRPACSKF